jgi:hypothetical protein
MNEWKNTFCVNACWKKISFSRFLGARQCWYNTTLRTIVQLTIRAAWVESSLWEGKRDSPMICWKGGAYYILPPSSTCAKSSEVLLCVPFFLQ